MPDARAEGAWAEAAPQADETMALSGAAREGYAVAYRSVLDESEIIRRHARMVKSIAVHLKGRLPESVQLDDLVQAGMIAVLRLSRAGALAPGAEAPLRRSIMNAMIDEARREAWAPVRTLRWAKTAAAAMRAVERRAGRHGTDEEIAAEMGIPLADYHRVLLEVAGVRLFGLAEIKGGGEELPHEADDPEAALGKGRLVHALAEAVATLPERERIVVSLYYERELSMEEVGEILGLDKSTVCRAHGRALLILRNALGEWTGTGAAEEPGRRG